jgi:hypothetical protein
MITCIPFLKYWWILNVLNYLTWIKVKIPLDLSFNDIILRLLFEFNAISGYTNRYWWYLSSMSIWNIVICQYDYGYMSIWLCHMSIWLWYVNMIMTCVNMIMICQYDYDLCQYDYDICQYDYDMSIWLWHMSIWLWYVNMVMTYVNMIMICQYDYGHMSIWLCCISIWLWYVNVIMTCQYDYYMSIWLWQSTICQYDYWHIIIIIIDIGLLILLCEFNAISGYTNRFQCKFHFEFSMDKYLHISIIKGRCFT